MTTDAIQPDVSTEEVQEEQRPLSEREQAMLQIQQELADRYGEPKQEETPAPPATPDVVDARIDGSTLVSGVSVINPDQFNNLKVRVKVDGQEQEMTLADVTKGYQKDSVASKRLEEAAKRQRDIDAREAALAERERQIQAQVAPLPPVGEEDLDLTAAFEAFEAGDSAGAAAIIAEAIKKGRQPATPVVDAKEIAAKVKAEVAAEQAEKERNSEFAAFVSANPIFAEPEPDENGVKILSKERVRGDYLFDTLYGPQIAAGKLSYREALDQTAAHVAREFAPPAPAPDPREERKKHIDNIPTASGARAAQTVKERTPEDALNDMRKWRGQAV